MELNEDNLIKEYFSRSHIVTIHFSKCKKSNLLTTLRIIGNKLNQYVCSIRYRDILEYDCDDMEIYNTVTNNAVYSKYHSADNCSHCIKFLTDYKKNLICGICIYPFGQIPNKRIFFTL